MKYLLTLTLLSVSCGEDVCDGEPDFYTSQGICTYVNDTSAKKEFVDKTIDILEREMNLFFGHDLEKIRKDYDKTSIIFQHSLKKDKVNGYTTFYEARDWRLEKYLTCANVYVKVYKDIFCFGYLTLLHEMLHVQVYSVEGIMGHPKEYFGLEQGTFEYDTETKVACEMCGYCEN